MRKRSLTITTVASEIGMNKSTLHNYCNGVIPRNIVTIKKLADYLGVSFSDLMFGENQQLPEVTQEIDCSKNCTITIHISHDK